jgi:hypothetical protein
MNRKNELYPYLFDQSIHTSVVVACLNDFCKKIKKKTGYPLKAGHLVASTG